jgi:uncharacterized membrane protein YwzB
MAYALILITIVVVIAVAAFWTVRGVSNDPFEETNID